MDDKTRDALEKIMILDEGCMAMPYKDTKGFWTIGIGHLIGQHLEHLDLPPEAVTALFQQDVKKHWRDMENIFGEKFVAKLEPARQIALFSLVYTLGARKLKLFHQTVPAIRAKDWRRVHDLLIKTKWAKDIDPKQRKGAGRDDRICYMFLTGDFHPDYKIGEDDEYTGPIT